MKGLFEQVRNAINVLLAMLVLSLWILGQNSDPRLDAFKLVMRCHDSIEFDEKVLEKASPQLVKTLNEVSKLVTRDGEYELLDAKNAGRMDLSTVSILVSESKSVQALESTFFLKDVHVGASLLMKQMKQAKLADDETVNDLRVRQPVTVQVPFVSQSIPAQRAAAIIGVILVIAYLYLYSSFVTILSENIGSFDSIDVFPLLCHRHFVGSLFGFGCVILPPLVWFLAVNQWRLPWDDDSVFSIGQGLLFGAWMGLLCGLALAVATRVWLVRLIYFYLRGRPNRPPAKTVVLTESHLPKNLGPYLLLPGNALIVGTGSPDFGHVLAKIVFGGMLAWFITILLLWTMSLGGSVSTSAVGIPIAIGLFFGIGVRSGVALFFQDGVVWTWGFG